MAVRRISDHQRHPSTAVFEAGISMGFYDSKAPNTLDTSTDQRFTFVYRVYVGCELGVSCRKRQLNTTTKVGPICIFCVQAQTPRN